MKNEDELQIKLPKGSKGLIISVINQTTNPLSLSSVKVSHGKLYTKPSKQVSAKDSSKFALEGERSIEARLKYKWETKGYIEVYFKYPKTGDGSASAYVEKKIANKIQVYIPAISWEKVTNISFICDEDSSSFTDSTAESPRNAVPPLDKQVKEKSRRLSNAVPPSLDISPPTPHANGRGDHHHSNGHASHDSSTKSVDDDDDSHSAMTENLSDNTSSVGDWSSDEEEDRGSRKFNFVIKAKSENTGNIPIPTLAPTLAALPSSRSFIRKRTKSLPPPPQLELKHSTSDTAIPSVGQLSAREMSPEVSSATAPTSPPTPTQSDSSGKYLDLLFGKSAEAKLTKEWSIGNLMGMPATNAQIKPPVVEAPKPGNAPVAKATSAEFMKSAFVDLESGNFDTSLNYISKAITTLAPHAVSHVKEIEYCVRYKVALRLLVKMNVPDILPHQGAYLSWFLASLSLRPNHRITCIRMAVKKNIQVGNYNVAYCLYQYLVERVKPVDIEAIKTKMAFCEQKKRTNIDDRFSKYVCYSCGQTVNVGAFWCVCGQPILFCGKTLELIKKKNYTACKLCNVVYSPAMAPAGSKCSQCEVGVLETKG